MKRISILSFAVVLLLSSAALSADTPPLNIRTAVSNLNRPWAMAFLPGHSDQPDGERLLITERPGRLLLLEEGKTQEVFGLPEIAAVGQGGLLDVILSPDFGDDSLVYLSYAEAGRGGYGTSVARGRLIARPSPRLEDVEVIYRALPYSRSDRHFGSRLAFDDEGLLYITLGERGDRERARDTHDPYGAVLRINPDGSVPRDNPFAPGGSRPGGGLPEVFTYGHRNPQGMAIHPETGEVWIHEHGPKGGDEINILSIGADYGWPLLTFGINYNGSVISKSSSAPGYEDPVLHWTPSIAPSGMAFYKGRVFPEWQGSLLVGALAGQHLRLVRLRGERAVDQEVLLPGAVGRIRDVRVSPGGYVYILTDENSGALYVLERDAR